MRVAGRVFLYLDHFKIEWLGLHRNMQSFVVQA
jgi:hypothetical protein